MTEAMQMTPLEKDITLRYANCAAKISSQTAHYSQLRPNKVFISIPEGIQREAHLTLKKGGQIGR